MGNIFLVPPKNANVKVNDVKISEKHELKLKEDIKANFTKMKFVRPKYGLLKEDERKNAAVELFSNQYKIVLDKGDYILKPNFDSTIFVNKKEIFALSILNDKDSIQIGKSKYTFRSSTPKLIQKKAEKNFYFRRRWGHHR